MLDAHFGSNNFSIFHFLLCGKMRSVAYPSIQVSIKANEMCPR